MNTREQTSPNPAEVQDRVWDTYLKGLLTFSYAPKEVIDSPGVEARGSRVIVPAIPLPVATPETIVTPLPCVAGDTVIPPPVWSNESFQCMFFRVEKMLLAAPLVTLREVVKYDAVRIKNLPGQARLSQGVMDHRGEIINLVDPGTILMGDRYHPSFQNYRYILLTDQPGIGFLCHEFVDMCKLDPGTVRWYQNRAKRPWLAGIHRQRLCTVIDIENLLPNPYSLTKNETQERTL
ncbi:MAG: chemotaxis protein CheW [Methylococcaceae bacterium]